MKRVVIVLALLLVISTASAENIQIYELFEKDIEYHPPNQNDDILMSYFYVGDKLVASSYSGSVKYYYKDRLDSELRGEYLPFGQEVLNSKDRFEFTGKELDDESGLNYFGARYYEASIGKFTSVDTHAGKGKNLPYAYVANNPLRFIDPDGRTINFPDSSEITQNFIKGLNDLFDTTDPVFYLSSRQLRYNEVDLSDNSNAEVVYNMIKKAIDSYANLYVEYTENARATYSSDTGTISFDPTNERAVPYGEESSDIYFTPQTSFTHELMHAFWGGEADAVTIANKLRALYGEEDKRSNPRVYYGGFLDSLKKTTKIWLYTPEMYDELVGPNVPSFFAKEIMRGHAFDSDYGDIFPYTGV